MKSHYLTLFLIYIVVGVQADAVSPNIGLISPPQSPYPNATQELAEVYIRTASNGCSYILMARAIQYMLETTSKTILWVDILDSNSTTPSTSLFQYHIEEVLSTTVRLAFDGTYAIIGYLMNSVHLATIKREINSWSVVCCDELQMMNDPYIIGLHVVIFNDSVVLYSHFRQMVVIWPLGTCNPSENAFSFFVQNPIDNQREIIVSSNELTLKGFHSHLPYLSIWRGRMESLAWTIDQIKPGKDEVQAQRAAACFDAVDKAQFNRSYITIDQYSSFSDAHYSIARGIPDARVLDYIKGLYEEFYQCDTNSDGRVTRSELIECTKKYYYMKNAFKIPPFGRYNEGDPVGFVLDASLGAPGVVYPTTLDSNSNVVLPFMFMRLSTYGDAVSGIEGKSINVHDTDFSPFAIDQKYGVPLGCHVQGTWNAGVVMVLQSRVDAERGKAPVGLLLLGWPSPLHPVYQTQFILEDMKDSQWNSEFHLAPGPAKSVIFARDKSKNDIRMYILRHCGQGRTQQGSQCVNCLPGTAQPRSLLSTCIPCSAGTYNPMTGSTTMDDCLKCPQGTFSEMAGQSSLVSCVKCPAGSYSTAIGADHRGTCKPCSPFTYSLEGSAHCLPCNPHDACGPFSSSNTGSPLFPKEPPPHRFPEPVSDTTDYSITVLLMSLLISVGVSLAIIGCTFVPSQRIKPHVNRYVDIIGASFGALLKSSEKEGKKTSRIDALTGLLFLSFIIAILGMNMTVYLNENLVVDNLGLQYYDTSNYTHGELSSFLRSARSTQLMVTLRLRGPPGICEAAVIGAFDSNNHNITADLITNSSTTSYGCTIDVVRPYLTLSDDDTFIAFRESIHYEFNSLIAFALGIQVEVQSGGNLNTGTQNPPPNNVFRGMADPTSFEFQLSPAIYSKEGSCEYGLTVSHGGIQPGSVTSVFNDVNGFVVNVDLAHLPYFHLMEKKERMSLQSLVLTVVTQIGGALSFAKLTQTALDKALEKISRKKSRNIKSSYDEPLLSQGLAE